MSAMIYFPALAFATSVDVMIVECPRCAWQVGEGGFGSVFQASGFRGKQAVAIKRGRRVDLTFELRDLKREVKLLQGCACMQRRSDINPVTQLRCRAEKLTGRPIQPHLSSNAGVITLIFCLCWAIASTRRRRA